MLIVKFNKEIALFVQCTAICFLFLFLFLFLYIYIFICHLHVFALFTLLHVQCLRKTVSYCIYKTYHFTSIYIVTNVYLLWRIGGGVFFPIGY